MTVLQIKEKLSRANMEAFKAPFFKKEELKMYEGIWNTKLSGMLGLAMPDVASLGAWLKSHSQCKYTLHGVTSHHLDDDYLTEIFRSGKWKPFISTLKDFYVLNEMVLATKVTIRLSKAVETGVSASLDPLAGIPSPAEIGVSVSLAANDTLEIVGATVNGVVQPFPIAFRCVHIVFNNDFTQVKKLELSRRRGDQDGLHVSEFVNKDEEYHIGAFFSNTVEEDEDDEDESDEDDASGPEVVPIRFNEVLDNVDAE